MRILVSGSRYWKDWETIGKVLTFETRDCKPEDVTIVHGAARGADSIAESFALERGYINEPHPAEWDKYGKRAGAIRNAEMAKLGADICLVFPMSTSIGSRMMIDMASRAGIMVKIYEG